MAIQIDACIHIGTHSLTQAFAKHSPSLLQVEY